MLFRSPVDLPKKGKNKKKKEATSSRKENDKPVDDIANNLKKMFPKPAKVEPEKEKVDGAAAASSSGTEQPVSKKKICWNCHATEEDGVKLLKCQQCKKARYCGRKCQEDDWNRHSRSCQPAEKKDKKKKKDANMELD